MFGSHFKVSSVTHTLKTKTLSFVCYGRGFRLPTLTNFSQLGATVMGTQYMLISS